MEAREVDLAFRPRVTEKVSIEIPKDVLHSLKQVLPRPLIMQRDFYIGQGSRQMTSLMWAAQDGYLALVRFLVSEGADIHMRDENGWTALMWATVGGHLALVRFLVSEGVDVNARI